MVGRVRIGQVLALAVIGGVGIRGLGASLMPRPLSKLYGFNATSWDPLVYTRVIGARDLILALSIADAMGHLKSNDAIASLVELVVFFAFSDIVFALSLTRPLPWLPLLLRLGGALYALVVTYLVRNDI